MAEKAQRTPAQRKVSSHLLHAARSERGEPIVGDAVLALSAVEIEPDGTVTVDIRADVAPEVLARIDALGGSVINSVPQYGAVRARLPLAAVESLAELNAVQSIRPADEAVTRGQSIAAAARTAPADPVVVRKVNTSEGDVAHRADQARRRYGVDGTGSGIGVLADGGDTLADRQASGDLPATVTVLPGQARPSEADDTVTFDEGTAMLEIVHDLAPGADLYFATAFNGQAQFAANIEALCAAGADVIVDDIGYLREAPFQDDIVAQGINAAVAAGCIYFSAGGNNGNLNAGTSGVWEGDFNEGTPFTIDGNVVGTSHRFNSRGANVNRITVYDFALMCLKWSDPLGASANDYDLYLVDPDENAIYTNVSSTDTQNGSQDPVECIPVLEFTATGEVVDLTRYRLLVVKAAGRGRYLHLNTHGGRLTFATDGQMYDHAAAGNAIGVAATNVAEAGGAGGVFAGPESVEWFSSDGPRRIFYHPDARAITPGNFSSTGGLLLQKPDVTAADGVSTATPEFETFHGTSAAAPHAAAIAALMLQAAGGPSSLTRAQLLQAMQSTALDIETPGAWDRDSGAGIIDALAAVSEVTSDLAVTVSFALPTYTATEGGPAAPVMVRLSDALDRVVTIPLATDPFGTDVTEADYALEAVAPARITVPDPARPWLLDLTIAANTTAATLMVTAVADREEDPGGVYIGIRGEDLPTGVAEGVPNSTSVEFREGDPAVTVSFALPTYTATEGGPAAPVMVRLSDALDRVVTIPLATDPFGTDVTEADYALEAVAPARITVPDPARPWLLDLTIAANTTAATLMVTAVADREEDPGGVYIGIRGEDLPTGVAEGVPNSTSVEFYENVGNFTDPLTSLATPIKAVHFEELRTRITALRARERLPAVQWTDPTLTAGVTRVRSVHLTELRAALDAVYDAVGQTRPGYTDAALTTGVTAIKAVHIMELRTAVVALEQ